MVIQKYRITPKHMRILRLLQRPGSRIEGYKLAFYLRVGRDHREEVREGFVGTLVRSGCIEATDFDGKANIYTITPEATRALQQWEAEGRRMSEQGNGKHEQCRWCPAPVIWAKHVKSEVSAPIDAEPVEGGNILVNAFLGTYRVASKEERASGEFAGLLRTNHWATCPEAESHKKNGGK